METASPDRRRPKPGSTLARFLELRGRKIVEACGVIWHSVRAGFFMSLPYQITLDPDPEELAEFLRGSAAVGVRFPSLYWDGLASGVYLRRRGSYDLSSVHMKIRGRVRRGLERFRIREVDPDQLLVQGRLLNLDTMQRQGRYDPEFGDPGQWRRFTRALRQCASVTALGAFDDDRLAAYMILCRDGSCLHILHQMSSTEALPHCPNHALTFSVTKQAAEDPEIDCCCYGLVPLVDLPGLHEYKLRFGYELTPHRSSVCFHPSLAWALGSGAARTVVRGLRFFLPSHQGLERLETVVLSARKTDAQSHLPTVKPWCTPEKRQHSARGD